MNKTYMALRKKHLFSSKHHPNSLCYSKFTVVATTLTESMQQQDSCITLSDRRKVTDLDLK